MWFSYITVNEVIVTLSKTVIFLSVKTPIYVPGSRHGTHFSTKDLESIGYHFCDSLLDFCSEKKGKVIERKIASHQNSLAPTAKLLLSLGSSEKLTLVFMNIMSSSIMNTSGNWRKWQNRTQSSLSLKQQTKIPGK